MTYDQTLTLDGKSVEELVVAGNYNWVNNDINQKNFPSDLSLNGEWKWDLWDPESYVSSKKANKAYLEDGWMSAMAQHHLAFGVKYPDAQKVNPIVGLGSSYHDGFGDWYVPVLLTDDVEPLLALCNCNCIWSPNYRFLRVQRLVV